MAYDDPYVDDSANAQSLRLVREILRCNNIDEDMSVDEILKRLEIEVEETADYLDDDGNWKVIRVSPLMSNSQRNFKTGSDLAKLLIGRYQDRTKAIKQISLAKTHLDLDPSLIELVRSQIMMPPAAFERARINNNNDDKEIARRFSVRPEDVRSRRKELSLAPD